MTQSSLAFHLFTAQACEELKAIVSGLPTPITYAAPRFLVNYVSIILRGLTAAPAPSPGSPAKSGPGSFRRTAAWVRRAALSS